MTVTLATRSGQEPATVVTTHRRDRRRWRNAGAVAFFLLPSAIPLVLFVLVPMATSAWVSLHRWNLITPMSWVGLGNYRDLLASPDTWAAFGHTLAYVAGYLPLVYVGGLVLALALNTGLRGRNLFRTVYFVPVVTSWVVVALTWRWLLNPANGPVNTLLAHLGIQGPGWWSDPAWAMPSVILASAWKDLGFVMVLLLAGLQAIPQEYLDAARVDGASAWQRFRHVTLPLLRPTILFVLVTGTIASFQVFTFVSVLTEGGPLHATDVAVYRIYQEGWQFLRFGTASAMSLVLAVLLGGVAWLEFRWLGRRVELV